MNLLQVEITKPHAENEDMKASLNTLNTCLLTKMNSQFSIWCNSENVHQNDSTPSIVWLGFVYTKTYPWYVLS